MMRYSAEEVAWLEENYHVGSMDDTLEAFEMRFGRRPGRSGLQTKASKSGWRKDVTAGKVKWDEERIEWFKSYVPGHGEREISAEHERLFGAPLREGQIAYAKMRFGVKSGTHGGRFEKGQESWNKGMTWNEFMSPEAQENSRRTHFKKGEVHGYAAMREQPVGSERISKDGYVEVKVGEGLQSKPNCNFRFKHHVVYEQHHGKIPDGCNVIFADHDKRNFDSGNLVAVPRSLWCVISHRHYQYWDAESLRLCMKIAEVDRARHAAERRPRGCRRCGEVFEPRYAKQKTCDKCLGRER